MTVYALIDPTCGHVASPLTTHRSLADSSAQVLWLAGRPDIGVTEHDTPAGLVPFDDSCQTCLRRYLLLEVAMYRLQLMHHAEVHGFDTAAVLEFYTAMLAEKCASGKLPGDAPAGLGGAVDPHCAKHATYVAMDQGLLPRGPGMGESADALDPDLFADDHPVTTRFTLLLPGDPLLKNEVIQGIRSGLFSPRGAKAAVAFLWTLKKEEESWRDAAIHLTRQALTGVPAIDVPVRATWTHLRITGQRVDTASPAYACWAILDGVVRAGMLPDDDKRYVLSQTWDEPRVVGYEGIELVLVTEPGTPQQDALPQEE